MHVSRHTRLVRFARTFYFAIRRYQSMKPWGHVSLDRANDRVAIDATYSPFAHLKVGATYGYYEEPIVRIVHGFGAAALPSWFAPQGNPSHIALHHPLGHAVFFEVRIDWVRRHHDRPFEDPQRATSEPLVELTLF